ncbi:MAG: hypothetical protein JNL10_07945 [Verrucomicrobiales bacterium]|nr:hypothetical protein [Verrucomicrobiales bacterium]
MSALSATVAFNWPDFLGPFHVIMLHYPIGFLSLAALLELWAIRRPSEPARRAVGYTLGLSVVVAWLATGLGLLRALHGEFDGQMLTMHKFSGIAVSVLATLTWVLHRRLYPDPERVLVRRTYRGLLAASLGCLLLAGHQGGTLTHGSKFLTAGAPHSMENLMGVAEAAPPAPSVPQDGDTYSTSIQPLLERKCIACHGPEKQKGHLRLDQRESALAAGDSGAQAIVPGDPMRSQLVKLILLPRNHDDVMPPDGKEPLTAEEQVALVHWVQSGASFGNTPSPVPASPFPH